MNQFYVELVRYRDMRAVKRQNPSYKSQYPLGPMDEKSAMRERRSAQLTINWSKHFVIVVPESEVRDAIE